MATKDNMDVVKKARTVIQKLFTSLEIKRVVCVDDQYDQQPSFEKFKLFYEQANIDDLAVIPGLESIVSADIDFMQDKELEYFWDNLNEKGKKGIFIQLRSKANNKDDTGYAATLKDLLQQYDFQELSLAQWRRAKPQLIKEAKAIKTLFLFDQDFSREGGSPQEGIRLIEDILASEESDAIMCGLLSHTFAPEQEHGLLEDYREAHETNSRDKFIFISKQQLDNNPIEFARRVKLTALSPKCKELKKIVADVIDQAHDKAYKQVDLIDIYDFEHMIFQSSIQEGVWEPDTLFRLFGLYHRFIAREMARSKDELHDIATYIRPISIISTNSIESPKYRSWEIQRLELYESEIYINNLHMPIELGDIFEVRLTDVPKQFILLAQPCDLMVRKNGRRKQTVTEVTLAEIISSKDIQRKDEKGRPLDQDAFYELSYFTEDGVKRYVNFQKKHSVRLSIIDLCVYQDNGSAYLNANQACPKYVIPTWERHYNELVTLAKGTIDQYKQIHSYCSKLAQKEAERVLALARARILALPASSSSNGEENLFTGEITLSDQSISYGLRRSGRLCQAHSAALLAKYAAFLARTAFEHDFGGGED